MNKVFAYKTGKFTASGKAVFAFIFAEDSTQDPNFPVASDLDNLGAGDDGWGTVLSDNADIVIVNERGEIDVDREVFAQRSAAAAAAQAKKESELWDEDDCSYVDDGL